MRMGKLDDYFTQATYYVKNFWKTVTILLLLYLFWDTFETRMMRVELTRLADEIRDSKRYAIKVNNRNNIEGFELKKITDSAYKYVIAAKIEQYLVKSAEDLTARAGKLKKFKDHMELFNYQKGTGGLREFYYNFIYSADNPNKSEEIIALEKQGQKAFINFLTKLAINLRQNNIPQSKDSLGINAKDIIYSVKDNKFVIEVKIQIKTAGITKEGISYKNIPQVAWFKLEGYINEEFSHEIINPLGIKFNSIEARPTLHPEEALNAIKLKKEKEKREAKRKAIMKKQQEKRY